MPIKIILADDHQIVRQGLRMLLACEPDMEVVGESDNGRDVVKLTQELDPDGHPRGAPQGCAVKIAREPSPPLNRLDQP